MITSKVFKISKNADTVLNFSYLAMKLLNFKSVVEKLPELEPRVSYSFAIKIVSRKKLSKVFASPQAHFRWSFPISKSRSVYEISQYFFAILKLYRWSIHIANNLILAISFGFKLNSNLNAQMLLSKLSTFGYFVSLWRWLLSLSQET